MDNKFIVNIQGTDFVKFEGLLNEFHINGGKSIYTKIIQSNPLIIQATVKGEKGTYQGIGDADESNVNKLIANHKIRMAETRAIARALRWYNNVGMCSKDELGDIPVGRPITKNIETSPLPSEDRNPALNNFINQAKNYKKPVAGDKCTKCGGKMVLNPKTQKVFCENKCWLNK